MESISVRWLVGIGSAVILIVVLRWGLIHDIESIALLALGVSAFSLYVAYSGQTVTAFKAGGMEATLAAAVTEALADPEVPQGVKERISEQVQDQPLPPPLRRATQQVLSRRERAMEYESEVKTVLTQLGGSDWKVSNASEDQPFDFEVVRVSDQKVVCVECRWSSAIATQRQLSDWVQKLAKGRPLGAGSVLVTPALPKGNQPALPKGNQGVGLVAWHGKTGEDASLKSAIDGAFR